MISSPISQRIELWPIDRLVEYQRNPRKNDSAVDRMCASIREFGFKIPCLVRSGGEVVDGHPRLKAARKLGITEIPVILCDEWTPAQVKAFRLMVIRHDNVLVGQLSAKVGDHLIGRFCRLLAGPIRPTAESQSRRLADSR